MFAVTSNVAVPVRHRPIALSAARARRAVTSRVSSSTVFFQDVTEDPKTEEHVPPEAGADRAHDRRPGPASVLLVPRRT